MGKKQTARDQLDDDFEIEQGQVYARSLGPRGNHQHEVEFIDGEKKLVTLPPRFRNVVWLKRGMLAGTVSSVDIISLLTTSSLGHYVIVDPTVGISEKVGGEIVQVLFPKNIKDLKAAGKWPEEFSDPKSEPLHQQQQPVSAKDDMDPDQDQDEDEDEQDDLFVNNNRPIMSDTDSSSDEEED
ncbi:RNA-binding protein EIF1AD-like [Mucor ambiguus]|uniref:RNA-binding protein EIF1AD-like n=1 Tax=Mucor ambiguus TaxID=91626 RepID=A0A0C9MPC9_9FUNG|nr:RNA-binding protein EIF1AD-like [Mucor ambiguus]